MLNAVLKIVALAGFVASLVVIAVRVPATDLIVVLLIVIAMAIYDFLIRPVLIRNGNNKRVD